MVFHEHWLAGRLWHDEMFGLLGGWGGDPTESEHGYVAWWLAGLMEGDGVYLQNAIFTTTCPPSTRTQAWDI